LQATAVILDMVIFKRFVSVKIRAVIGIMTPCCGDAGGYRNFRETYCPTLDGTRGCGSS